MSGAPRLQIPPDRCEPVSAARVLVLAPHPDDEVLGCGGLLLQLLTAGAAVRVLMLTDGAGGDEAVDDREAYRGTRRDEAAAVAAAWSLGAVEGGGLVHLDLPDGELGRHLEAAAAGIRQAILELRPELVLVPSPLEASADHRAAFAALHRLLGAVRPTSEADEVPEGELAAADLTRAAADLSRATTDLTILAYEINRPAYPDLLVDVTAELPRLGEAMELYASQQERRDYWRASRGLRSYRTLTLDAAVEAAEGYRRLTLDDFVTRSPAQLVRELGGLPEIAVVEAGPPVSVVVRTKDRPELLRQALSSLADGAYRQVEVVVVNDGGDVPDLPGGYPFPIALVDLPENRGRAAAADAGVERASGRYVAFLDDDDLAAPEHLATLAGLVGAAGVRVAYTDAAVGVYELDPESSGWSCVERRLPYSRDFDADLLLVDNYIPFNTLLIERALFSEVGAFDRSLPFFEDWDFLIRLAARTPFHHLPRVTCEYRHFRGAGHHILGERPRRRGDFLQMKARVLAKHADRLSPERAAAAVDTLRRELVEATEAGSALRREARELRREATRATDRYHRAHGEVEALRAEGERLSSETRRLYEDERELRTALDERDDHLRRTYAEIERLTELMRAMESTRAWRAHQWIQRRRGR